MSRKIFVAMFVLAMVCVIIASVTTTHAQTGGTYELTWSTIDDGGGTSTGGTFSLDGTIGQPDTGVMSGGAYSLGSGFWAFATNVVNSAQKLFLPMILKSP